jgi:hypothetical protein
VSEVCNLQSMMTIFSSPAYATMLSNRDVLLLGQKAKAFIVYLPVPFCLIIYLLTFDLLDSVADTPFPRVSANCPSSLIERREASKHPSQMMIHAIHSQSPL